ncbi:MAG: phosphohydrolase [Thermotoga sp.]|nr:MAG: phosphohydrolase [Thermotoga sp.]
MKRDEAYSMVKEHVKNRNLVYHMLACEAIMRALAKHFREDEEMWGMAGLLHDLDYPETVENPSKHGLITIEMLKDKGVDKKIMDAILAHCGKKTPETLMEKALYAVDPMSGLIVASALITPAKKLSAIDGKFVKRRFKEKAFAKGASREQIKTCESFGVPLDEFLDIGVRAMQSIADEIGL